MSYKQVLIVDFGTQHINSITSVVKSHISPNRIRIARVNRPDTPSRMLKFGEVETEDVNMVFVTEHLRQSDAAIILTGSPDHVGDPNGFRSISKGVFDKFEGPILGVCYGHQLIGTILDHDCKMVPHAEHGSTIFLPRDEAQTDPLFSDFPKAGFVVSVHHNWSLSKVPEGFINIGETRGTHTIISAIRAINRPIYGVQFHPELPVSGYWSGLDLMGRFVEMAMAGAPV